MACCQTFVCRFFLLETDTEHLLILWICCIFQGSDKLRRDRFFFFFTGHAFPFSEFQSAGILILWVVKYVLLISMFKFIEHR
jgi:hypothetical protein